MDEGLVEDEAGVITGLLDEVEELKAITELLTEGVEDNVEEGELLIDEVGGKVDAPLAVDVAITEVDELVEIVEGFALLDPEVAAGVELLEVV